MSRPLSPDTRAVLAAIDGHDTPRVTVAQGLRALAFLKPGRPITNDQLIRIAEELDPCHPTPLSPAPAVVPVAYDAYSEGPLSDFADGGMPLG